MAVRTFASIAEAVAHYFKRGYETIAEHDDGTRVMRYAAPGAESWTKGVRIERVGFLSVNATEHTY